MKNTPSHSKGIFKRLLDLGGDSTTPPDILKAMDKKQLQELVRKLQQENLNLHHMASLAHEHRNIALRIVGTMYSNMFGLVDAYTTAVNYYRELKPGTPVPVMWLAARLCENYEQLFDNHDLTETGPQKELLIHLYAKANRPLNPGSNMGKYLGMPQPEGDDPQMMLITPDADNG